MAIATFPKFSGIGRTSSLLDKELLLIGNDDLGTRGRTISIQKPRDGLLAMKYTVQELPLTQSPHQHSSLVLPACQLVDNHVVLVSGGLPQKGGDPSTILRDELYNLTSQEVVKVLPKKKSLKRSQHAMIRVGDRILT